MQSSILENEGKLLPVNCTSYAFTSGGVDVLLGIVLIMVEFF